MYFYLPHFYSQFMDKKEKITSIINKLMLQDILIEGNYNTNYAFKVVAILYNIGKFKLL